MRRPRVRGPDTVIYLGVTSDYDYKVREFYTKDSERKTKPSAIISTAFIPSAGGLASCGRGTTRYDDSAKACRRRIYFRRWATAAAARPAISAI